MQLGFSDDEQRQSLGELVGAYHDVAKALDVERTAMDLARFSGVDLATASDTLIKVHAGNYRALKALGIQTDNIHDETSALAAIQKVASGQAEDYANTIEGKLTVAQVKGEESSEKFGKSVARLQADVIPAVADAVSGLADQFDALQTGMDETVPPTERADAVLQGLRSSIVGGLPGMKEWIAAGQQLNDSEKEQAASTATQTKAIRDSGTQARGTAGLFDTLGDKSDYLRESFKRTVKPGGTLRELLRDLGYAADKTDDAIGDLAGTIEDELFGDAINAGNEARLKDEIADLRDQRSETTKGSRKWKELTGEIAENEKALFDLHLEQAKEKGPEAVIDFLEQEKSQLRKSDAAARKYIDDLIALYQLMTRYKDLGVISFGRYTGKTIPGFASGVKNFSGGMAVVGEDGPEIVNLPKGSDVIPNAGAGATTLSGGASAPMMVPIPVPMSWTPSQQQAWANEAGPAMVRWMQQRGMIARAGAF